MPYSHSQNTCFNDYDLVYKNGTELLSQFWIFYLLQKWLFSSVLLMAYIGKISI